MGIIVPAPNDILTANTGTFAGLLKADSLYITQNIVASSISAGSITNTTGTFSGLVSADSVYATRQIIGATVTTSGLITADSFYAVNTVVGSSHLGTTATLTGLVSADSLYATRQVIADSLIAVNSVVAKNIYGTLPIGSRQSMQVSSAAITNSETLVSADSFIANRLQAGTVLRVWAIGVKNSTSTGGDTFKVRIGTTALNGTPVAWVTCATANPGATGNAPFWFESMITIRTAGASGTFYGLSSVWGDTNYFAGQKFGKINPTTLGTINTTVANLVQLTYNSNISTSNNTFYEAGIEVVRP
jgi:hypothetical protein